MANGWYGVELGAPYRAFAISRWGAGSDCCRPRHRARPSAPRPPSAPPQPSAPPPPQHRDGKWLVWESGGAIPMRLPSRWGAGSPDSCWPPTPPPSAPRPPSVPRPPLGLRPALVTERWRKWLELGRAGAPYRAFAISRWCRVRYSCRPSAPDLDLGTAPGSHTAALGTAPAPDCARLGIERWQMAGIWSSWGRHTVVCHLSGGTRRGQGEGTGGARVREPAGPSGERALQAASPEQQSAHPPPEAVVQLGSMRVCEENSTYVSRRPRRAACGPGRRASGRGRCGAGRRHTRQGRGGHAQRSRPGRGTGRTRHTLTLSPGSGRPHEANTNRERDSIGEAAPTRTWPKAATRRRYPRLRRRDATAACRSSRVTRGTLRRARRNPR